MTDPLALDPLDEAALAELARRTSPPHPLREEAPVTSRLRLQMTEADRLATRAAMPARLRELWQRAGGEPGRTRVELAAVVALGLGEIAARAGLPQLDGRAEIAAPGLPRLDERAAGAGSVAELLVATLDTAGADLVVAALAAARVPLAEGAVVLDAGSGRAARLRALAAAREDLVLRGEGDRGRPADVAVALDALATCPAGAAVTAVACLRNALAPGGCLVLGVRGLHAFAHDVGEGALTASDAASAVRGLYRSGHHHAAGSSYVTLDWLGAHVVGPLALLLHAQGVGDDGGDVVVLQRRV